MIELRFHGADDTTAHCKLSVAARRRRTSCGGCAASRSGWRGARPRAARRPPRDARAGRVSGLSLTAPADRAALGAEVCAVAAGSAAMAAGLRAGCRVLSINGSVVRAHRDGGPPPRDRPGVRWRRAVRRRRSSPRRHAAAAAAAPAAAAVAAAAARRVAAAHAAALGGGRRRRRAAPRAADRPSDDDDDDDDDDSGGGDSLGSPQTPRDGQADAVVVTSLDDV